MTLILETQTPLANYLNRKLPNILQPLLALQVRPYHPLMYLREKLTLPSRNLTADEISSFSHPNRVYLICLLLSHEL